MKRLLLMMVFVPVLIHAQYGQEWQTEQYYSERGILYFDYNQDGFEDLTKYSGNVVSVFDGADGWSLYWTLTDAGHESLLPWDLYRLRPGEGRTMIFISSNYTDSQTTRVLAYAIQGTTPLWASTEQQGYYTFVDTSDTDDDGVTEIIWGINRYTENDSTYHSKFQVLNGRTGAIEYTSAEFTGMMVGPYSGDVDGDDTCEIILNLYDTHAFTSTLHCFSSNPSSVSQPGSALLPKHVQLGQNYPNPFNPGTTIPLSIEQSASVRVNIYDIEGRHVRSLMDSNLPAGQYQFFWDGLSSAGQAVATGVYFCQIELDGHAVRRPMVHVK